MPAGFIAVVMPHPVGQGESGAILVSTLGREIQIEVSSQPQLVAACIAGIGVKDIPGLVLEEDADAGDFFTGIRQVALFKVVEDSAACKIVLGGIECTVIILPMTDEREIFRHFRRANHTHTLL